MPNIPSPPPIPAVLGNFDETQRTIKSLVDYLNLLRSKVERVLPGGADSDFSETDPNAILKALMDAKGDLITATAADTPVRKAVGTNRQALLADSAQGDGLRWGNDPILNGALVQGAAPATPAANVLYTDSVVKAWVQVSFSAGTPSIDADLNISSITDNGVGLVVLNLATNMASATYAVATCGDRSDEVFVGTGTKTASTIPIEITDRNGTAFDGDFTAIAIGLQ